MRCQCLPCCAPRARLRGRLGCSGLAFWTAELQSGAVTPGLFIVTLEASVNMQTGTADATTLMDNVAEDYVLRIAASNTPFMQATAYAAMARSLASASRTG